MRPCRWTPFGLVRASAATSAAPLNPFGFTGEYRDGVTGLLHLRARQYDPGTGRFSAVDPVSPGVGEPYVSAYAYVANNPVRWVDPTGRCPCCIAGLIGAGIGALVGAGSYVAGSVVANAVTGKGLTEGLNLGDAAKQAVNGGVVGGVSGLTFGLGTVALGGATIGATSAEAWALASLAGPLGSAAGIIFKGLTGQPVGGSDAAGTIGNMIPLPSGVGLQVGLGIVFDQVAAGAIGRALK